MKTLLVIAFSPSDRLVQALGNTLLYSLVQGIALAVAAGLIILLTRKSSAQLRYNLLTGSLVLFTAAIVLTFIWELSPVTSGQPTAPLSQLAPVGAKTGVTPAQIQLSSQQVGAINGLWDYSKTHADFIVLLWFLILCMKSVRLVSGMQEISRLKTQQILVVKGHWHDRVTQITGQLGFKRAVTLLESGLARVPMAVGHLKPMVLIPAGMLTALPPAEIEAILVHELAHIYRRDYLVNLFQCLLEIIFFFNPAVLWVSALVKTARENCCDDIAVAQTSNKVAYIRALIACQEYRQHSPAYAMAMAGNKNGLLNRVKRMYENRNDSLNRIEKALLSLCLVTGGVLMLGFTKAEDLKLAVNKVRAVINDTRLTERTPSNPDTLKVSPFQVYELSLAKEGHPSKIETKRHGLLHVTYLFKEKGIVYQLNYERTRLSSMQVNGHTVPSDRLAGYFPIIGQLMRTYYPGTKDPLTPEQKMQSDQKLADREAVFQDSLAKISVNLQALKVNASVDIPIKETMTRRDLAILDSLSKIDERKVKDLSAEQSLKIKDMIKRAEDQYKPYDYRYESYPSKTDKKSTGYQPYESAAQASVGDQVVNELLADGIIFTRNKALSFKLTGSEFIINGRRQPEAVFRKYRDKFVPAPTTAKDTWTLYHNFDPSSSVTSAN